jgi:hypothetical protein
MAGMNRRWKPIDSFVSPTALDFERHVISLDLAASEWHPQFVVLHNTAKPTLAEWPSVPGPQRIQNLVHYYRDEQVWSAGPHLFVAPEAIYGFTPLTTPGVHSPSWNEVSWGVEIVGDFSTETLSAAHRQLLVGALSILHKYGKLDPLKLRLHREDPLTTHICPGNAIVKPLVIGWVRSSLAAQKGQNA